MRNINNLRYSDDTTLMAESKEELKKVKEKSEKAGLKLNIQKIKIMASSPIHCMANSGRNYGNSDRLYFGGAPKSLQVVTSAMKLKDGAPMKKSDDHLRQHSKRQRHYFADKGPSSQFSSVQLLGRVRLFVTP